MAQFRRHPECEACREDPSTQILAAAILCNGPIVVTDAALRAVKLHGMSSSIHWEIDKETGDRIYTIPER